VKSLAALLLLAAVAGAALSSGPLLVALALTAVLHAWAGPRRQGTAAKTGANPRLGAPPASEVVIATIYERSGRLVLRRRLP
jgi:hypothetical protein